MPALPIPDHDTLKSWLEHCQIDYYLCGTCQGLHLPQLQENLGIYDAKIEIEGDFVYLSASIEVRPSGLMTAFAQIDRELSDLIGNDNLSTLRGLLADARNALQTKENGD